MLKSLFNKKEKPIKTYNDFWEWFQLHQKKFYKIVNEGDNIESGFFDKLAPKLDELNSGFWYLAGMYDNKKAELIITPDGVVENIVFVEELIQCAPKLDNWKFTALKPSLEIDNANVEMNDYNYGIDTLSFYCLEDKNYPDEINLKVIHNDFNIEDKSTLLNGVFIFLDNYLGELRTVTLLDELEVIGKDQASEELIPINKLKDYLIWREKEFVEKYEGIRHNTENDSYSSLEATLKNGLPIIAIVNTDLLNWDSKASHPWFCVVSMEFDGSDNNGLPNKASYQLLNKVEEEINKELKDEDGYLNIGRDSGNNKRRIYLAFKDFRKPSKILAEKKRLFEKGLAFNFEIYKDKYWRTMEKYNQK